MLAIDGSDGKRLYGVRISGTKLTDDLINAIGSMGDLESLLLSGTGLTDAQFVRLKMSRNSSDSI